MNDIRQLKGCRAAYRAVLLTLCCVRRRRAHRRASVGGKLPLFDKEKPVAREATDGQSPKGKRGLFGRSKVSKKAAKAAVEQGKLTAKAAAIEAVSISAELSPRGSTARSPTPSSVDER